MIDDVQSVIDACLSSDGAAWSVFFKEYASVAMNILNRLAGALPPDDREDIVQNTFSKLLKGGLRNFRGSTRYEFLAYFRRIVVNEARTYLRSEREWRDAVPLDDEKDRERIESALGTGYGEHGIGRNEQLQIVRNVLQGSPLETQQVLLMKMEGYKDREIADILGISMGTVASRYARVRERIKGSTAAEGGR